MTGDPLDLNPIPRLAMAVFDVKTLVTSAATASCSALFGADCKAMSRLACKDYLKT